MNRKSVPIWISIIQIAAITSIALVAGSTFGIWLGYNPLFYSASTFVEVHQGAVKGLNFLLPAIAMTAIVCVIVLAYRIRRSGTPFYLYLLALALIMSGGLITRFINQPINADIVNWSPTSLPDGWQSVRNTWWTFHIVRTISSITAMVLLIIAVLQDRSRNQT